MKTLEQIEAELKAKGFESERELFSFMFSDFFPHEDWVKLEGFGRLRSKNLWNKWQKEKEAPTLEEVKERYENAKVVIEYKEEDSFTREDMVDFALYCDVPRCDVSVVDDWLNEKKNKKTLTPNALKQIGI